MARTVVTLTQAWQQVGTAERLIVTVKDGLSKRLYLAEEASDVAALKVLTTDNRQFAQTEEKDTFARCEVDGLITVIVETEG